MPPYLKEPNFPQSLLRLHEVWIKKLTKLIASKGMASETEK